MIRKLMIENFFSIKEPQTLDLEIARNATDPDGRFVTPIKGSPARFPRVVVLFGANASGKTNVLRAFLFLADFVMDSFHWPRERLRQRYAPFADTAGRRDGTRLTLEFEEETFYNDKPRRTYVYHLEIDYQAQRVRREALFHFPLGRKGRLFERIGEELKFGKGFKPRRRSSVPSKIPPGASLISTYAHFEHPGALAACGWMRKIITNVEARSKASDVEPTGTEHYKNDANLLRHFVRQVGRIDLGIEGVALKAFNGEVRPVFTHDGLALPLPFELESGGTKLFYNVFPHLSAALNEGGVAVFDELDADIHPLLLPEFVRMFQDKETNPKNAQLIMSCHSATLLEYLEKEEVFFTEKDAKGRTAIYGLKNIKGVRRDMNLYGKYLLGAFGAIPNIG